MKTFLIVILIVIVVAGLYFFGGRDNEESNLPKNDEATEQDTAEMMKDSENIGTDKMMKEVDNDMKTAVMEMVYEYSGDLDDVTKGEDVRGVNTRGRASGVAKANYDDNGYSLLVTFENLPDPVGTDFYEGWVVRRGLNFSVISSGALEKVDGVYMNTYASGRDLTDHDFYVLTLEPDDGDPAPADHILEGMMEGVPN